MDPAPLAKTARGVIRKRDALRRDGTGPVVAGKVRAHTRQVTRGSVEHCARTGATTAIVHQGAADQVERLAQAARLVATWRIAELLGDPAEL